MRLVTLSPSRPASGESFTEKVMDNVGGSTGLALIGWITSGSQMVSATVVCSSPAMATMSPASALSMGRRSSPRKASRRVRRACSITRPSGAMALTCIFVLAIPLWMRPVSTRPRYESYSSVVTSIAKGASRLPRAGGTWLAIRSKSGVMSLRSSARSATAQPCLEEAKSVGKSSCASVAPNAANRSKIMSWTSWGRASLRSTLLITTMGRRPSASAFMVTNLVWGMGPSAASTRTTTPSTMLRMRSTSPPKSAWPGVSTMLRRLSFQATEVHLARMVMPRSRSRSLVSIARSCTC